MTERAKEKAAIAGISFVMLAGIGCMSAGIWAIATMPMPYMNQWINMADDEFEFKPIMHTVTEKQVDAWAKANGVALDDPDKLPKYYFSRVTLTPEIFVDDFLSHVNRSMQGQSFTNNTLRLSNPSFKKVGANEMDDKYLLSFQWDQQVEFTPVNETETWKADWTIKFEDVPVELNKNATSGKWWLEQNLMDEGWKGHVNIKDVHGFNDQQKIDTDIDHTNYTTLLNSWFYEFNFKSDYLDIGEN